MTMFERLEERRLFAANVSVPLGFSVQNSNVQISASGMVQDRPGGGCIMLNISGQTPGTSISVNVYNEWGSIQD